MQLRAPARCKSGRTLSLSSCKHRPKGKASCQRLNCKHRPKGKTRCRYPLNCKHRLKGRASCQPLNCKHRPKGKASCRHRLKLQASLSPLRRKLMLKPKTTRSPSTRSPAPWSSKNHKRSSSLRQTHLAQVRPIPKAVRAQVGHIIRNRLHKNQMNRPRPAILQKREPR